MCFITMKSCILNINLFLIEPNQQEQTNMDQQQACFTFPFTLRSRFIILTTNTDFQERLHLGLAQCNKGLRFVSTWF